MCGFDRRKCLQELERDDWGEPSFQSHLVTTCHALRRKPLCEFTAGDLRIMIGQNISSRFLMPMALEQLENDPFVEADFYPGDLLLTVVHCDPQFWAAHNDLLQRIRSIVNRARDALRSLDATDRRLIDEALRNLAPPIVA
jgi:CDI immunity proteins